MQDSIGQRLSKLQKGEVSRINMNKITESLENGLPDEELAQEIMVEMKLIKDIKVQNERL